MQENKIHGKSVARALSGIRVLTQCHIEIYHPCTLPFSPLLTGPVTISRWGKQQLQFRIRIRSRMRTLKSSPVLISSPSSASSGYKYISIGVVQRTHGGGGRHCTVQPACSTLSRMASSPEAKTLASLLHVESWALALSQSSRVACRDLRFTLPEPIFSLAFLARTRVLL